MPTEDRISTRNTEIYKLRFQLPKIHDDLVSTAKISPNGQYIATASSDKTVRLWEAATGNYVRKFEGHTRGVSELCWSPDSSYIASASDDMSIRIWSVEFGACLKELRGHTYHITCVEFSPKGNILISGSSDEAIRVWDIQRGKCLKTLSAHSDPISSIDLCWDGTMIASASYDGQIRIFDTETGQCLKTLIYDRGGSSSPVSYVRFSPNGKYVLASSLDGSIRLWDYMNNKVAKTFTADKEPIAEKYTCGTRFLLLDGQSQPLVVSGSDSGKIYIWDVQSKDILSVLNGGDEDSDSNCPVLQVDAFDNGVALVSVSRDGVLKVWDLIDKKKDVEME